MSWLEAILQQPVSRETVERLDRYEVMVRDENARQNLVAPSTLADFRQRHLADGAQLVRLAPPSSSWLDIGSGVGVPGIVIAALQDGPVTLCEPRPLRADFLQRVIDDLGLANASVVTAKVEKIDGSFDVITARAVASLDRLFAMAWPRSHKGTRWILPKGRKAQLELDEAQRSWQGAFRTEPSLTDPEASIIVAEQVKRRGKK